jgi:predicted alpha/beta superfamily hydrolase
METPKNVCIIDNAFYMPQLHRWRRIWLYLPDGYAETARRYPVIYMHDGQNLFEEWSSFGDEWQVDETIDSMRKKAIVVGIDNGGAYRISEYKINDDPVHGRGEGMAYLHFIVETLKPYIDSHFRTLEDRESTIIAGSSMGGLISFYAGLYFGKVFGKAGVFSPSFWLAPGLAEEIGALKTDPSSLSRFYFYAGEQEGEEMATQVRAIAGALKTQGVTVEEVYNPDGEHSEANWREQFPHFYKWIHRGASNLLIM